MFIINSIKNICIHLFVLGFLAISSQVDQCWVAETGQALDVSFGQSSNHYNHDNHLMIHIAPTHTSYSVSHCVGLGSFPLRRDRRITTTAHFC